LRVRFGSAQVGSGQRAFQVLIEIQKLALSQLFCLRKAAGQAIE
jgi:hypothetical protein